MMTMRNVGWLSAVALMVMPAGLTHAAVPGEFKPEWIPQLAVPRMTRPPVIDGEIDPSEWRESAALGGVGDPGHKLIPRPTTYFLAWDAGHLYLAVRTYLRPGYKPAIQDGRADGMTYTFDDGLELVWKPMGANVVNRNAAYKFFLNCLGFKGDTCRLTLGQMFKDWNPQFKTATRMTEPGSAPNGGRWWELEMSCTPEDFELKGEHRAGDEWRLMLGFNHIPGWMQARIPCLGPYFDSTGGGFPRAILVENTPAVQMTMDSLSNLATDGTAALQIKAFNPTAAEVAVAVRVNVAEAVVKTETLKVPAGGETVFTLNEKLPDTVKDGLIQVAATLGDKTLLSYTAFFQRGHAAHMLAPVTPPDPNQFGLKVSFSPVRQSLYLAGDTYFFERPEDAVSMGWKVFPEGKPGKVVASGRADKSVMWRFQDLVGLPKLNEGKYTVEAVIAMKDGTTRGPMTATIEKRDEAKAFPQWWDTRIGSPDKVIPPFEAIRRVKDGVKVEGKDAISHQPSVINYFSLWGREVAFDALGLPAALRSQGTAVLAAPARLVVTVGGQETVIPVGKPKITEQKEWRVRFEGQARGAGLAFRATGWLEQDGLVYVELTYGPDGREPVTIDALRIEYPLAEADADALVCFGPGGNFSSMTAMLLPKVGSSTLTPGPSPTGRGEARAQQLWSTHVTGQPGARMVRGSFYPTVWVGSERRGLVWWADNDKGWVQSDEVPAHEVVRTATLSRALSETLSTKLATKLATKEREADTCVILRNHIVAAPVELTEPRTIAFSYMATPFRPFTKGWRAVNCTDDGTFFVPHRSARKDSKTGMLVNASRAQMNWIHPESRYPEEWDALWAEQKTTDALGFAGSDRSVRESQWFDPYAARSGIRWHHMSFTLRGWGPKTIEDNLMRYFAPGERWDDELDTSFIDYAMYLFDGAFGKGGVVQTYWDITFPNQNDNPVSGLCYPLPDGRIQPGYIGWNARRFYQRLQSLMADHQLVPNGNGGHSTQAYLTIAMPWMDAVLDGELNFNIDVSDRDFADLYPVERMRAMSSPHNWGVPICWMGHFDTTDPKKADFARIKRAEYLWLHDSWKNLYGGAGRVVMPDTVLDFGLNGDATAYHPYWRNPYVTSDNDKLLVSLWRLADRDDTAMVAVPLGPTEPVDRVLLGVFNYDRANAQPVRLTVDLKALGLDQPDTVVVARELYNPEDDSGVIEGNHSAAQSLKSYYPGGNGNHRTSALPASACTLDAASGTLTLPAMPPHRARYIGLRLERKAEAAALADRLNAAAASVGATPPVVSEAALVWGAAEPGATFHELGQAKHVTGANPAIRVAAWIWRDRVLLAVANTGDQAVGESLAIDLDQLGLTPRLPWQEFIRLRDFGTVAGAADGSAALDFHGRKLNVKVAPKSLRLVGIRRY